MRRRQSAGEFPRQSRRSRRRRPVTQPQQSPEPAAFSVAYSQTDRPIRVSSPLGPDALLVERLFCNEAVSEQFEIVLDLLSVDAAIDPKDLLRKPMTVSVLLDEEGNERHWNGVVR